jgi:hypothetical protein
MMRKSDPTLLQELHQSYLEAAHAFSEKPGQPKKRGKRLLPSARESASSRSSASAESRQCCRVGSSSGREGSNSEYGEAPHAASAPGTTRAPTADVDGLGKTEFVVSMLVSLGCVECAAMLGLGLP